MKKMEVEITKIEEPYKIIEDTLYSILISYSNVNFSNNHHIKIKIQKGISIIIKMLMPFEGSDSIYYSYMKLGDQKNLLYCQAMQVDANDSNKSLRLFCHNTASIVNELITQLSDVFVIKDSFTFIHNLDVNGGSVTFVPLDFSDLHTNEERIERFIYWTSENLTSECNKAYVKLDIFINPNQPEEASATYELMVEYNKIFCSPKYSLSFKYPGVDPYTVLALDYDDFADALYEGLLQLDKISSYACLDGEKATLTFYKSEEV